MANINLLREDDRVSASCWNKITESKWTDATLIASCIALTIIGILASQGAFHPIGTTGAAPLSYAMFSVAGLLLLVEIAKITANKCRGKDIDQHNNPNELSAVSLSQTEKRVIKDVLNSEDMSVELRSFLEEIIESDPFQKDPIATLEQKVVELSDRSCGDIRRQGVAVLISILSINGRTMPAKLLGGVPDDTKKNVQEAVDKIGFVPVSLTEAERKMINEFYEFLEMERKQLVEGELPIFDRILQNNAFQENPIAFLRGELEQAKNETPEQIVIYVLIAMLSAVGDHEMPTELLSRVPDPMQKGIKPFVEGQLGYKVLRNLTSPRPLNDGEMKVLRNLLEQLASFSFIENHYNNDELDDLLNAPEFKENPLKYLAQKMQTKRANASHYHPSARLQSLITIIMKMGGLEIPPQLVGIFLEERREKCQLFAEYYDYYRKTSGLQSTSQSLSDKEREAINSSLEVSETASRFVASADFQKDPMSCIIAAIKKETAELPYYLIETIHLLTKAGRDIPGELLNLLPLHRQSKIAKTQKTLFELNPLREAIENGKWEPLNAQQLEMVSQSSAWRKADDPDYFELLPIYKKFFVEACYQNPLNHLMTAWIRGEITQDDLEEGLVILTEIGYPIPELEGASCITPYRRHLKEQIRKAKHFQDFSQSISSIDFISGDHQKLSESDSYKLRKKSLRFDFDNYSLRRIINDERFKSNPHLYLEKWSEQSGNQVVTNFIKEILSHN